jgi:hypothetical protein
VREQLGTEVKEAFRHIADIEEDPDPSGRHATAELSAEANPDPRTGRFRLTEKGRRRAGANFADLAIALWQEIREIKDPEVRAQRLAQRRRPRGLDVWVIGGDVGGLFIEVAQRRAQPQTPPADASGALVVLTTDGKGVPMTQPSAMAPPVRLGKGQKRTTKKAAVVTSLSTMASYPRTPQEVVAALRREGDRPATQTRPGPVGKELRATLEGKEVAVTRLELDIPREVQPVYVP